MFERIKNDPYIIDIYKKIENSKFDDKFWTYHGLIHVNNVVDTVETIITKLGYDNEYIESAKIAALLHDVGMIEGKENHEIKGHDMAKKYFEDHKIQLKYQNEILEAIKLHRNASSSNNNIAIVLVFADKIDIKKTRITSQGRTVVGLRQYQYIDDIYVDIDMPKNKLKVQFLINKNCNKKELESWYFTSKVCNAIDSFANHFNFDSTVLWNEDSWSL